MDPDRLPRNIANHTPTYTAQHPKRAKTILNLRGIQTRDKTQYNLSYNNFDPDSASMFTKYFLLKNTEVEQPDR